MRADGGVVQTTSLSGPAYVHETWLVLQQQGDVAAGAEAKVPQQVRGAIAALLQFLERHVGVGGAHDEGRFGWSPRGVDVDMLGFGAHWRGPLQGSSRLFRASELL